MYDVRITVMKTARYPALIERYELPLDTPCTMREGQTFLSRGGKKPEGMCDSAWESMRPFAEELSRGGGNFFGGWLKNGHSAMISCNDGFRPVSFLLETVFGKE